jgi:dissimilatory sulfite reductase (desulfoviridin) alpha/beta subunit
MNMANAHPHRERRPRTTSSTCTHAAEELRQLEVARPACGPACCTTWLHSGDEVWTVRAGTQRQMDVYTIRKLCDIADRYAEGHVRFTIRSNIEFMVSTRTRSRR